jgi:hypothetical protein
MGGGRIVSRSFLAFFPVRLFLFLSLSLSRSRSPPKGPTAVLEVEPTAGGGAATWEEARGSGGLRRRIRFCTFVADPPAPMLPALPAYDSQDCRGGGETHRSCLHSREEQEVITLQFGRYSSS